jgi:hypothetical protein
MTALPGESPCRFIAGADGWVVCDVHGWSGPKSQRSRVLICPDARWEVGERPDLQGYGALRALSEKATPGKAKAIMPGDTSWAMSERRKYRCLLLGRDTDYASSPMARADVEFIVAAVNYVRAALATSTEEPRA